MSLGAAVFMAATWLTVIGLNAFCFWKIFSKQ